MKRREFLSAATGLAGWMVHDLALSQSRPCPPPALGVIGGTSAETRCGVAGAPPWFEALSDKTWSAIPGTVTGTLRAARDPNGKGDPLGIVDAWCGATVDTQREEFVIPAQGGHASYLGNEVLVLSLNSAAPAWTRRSNSRTANSGSVMDDGSPCPAHSEGQLCYAANVDRILMTTQPYWQGPSGGTGSTEQVFSFNPSAGTWAKHGNAPVSDAGLVHGGSAYDPVTGLVWIVATENYRSTASFNPQTGVFTNHGGSDNLVNAGYQTKVTISPSKRCLVVVNGSRGQSFYAMNLDPVSKWTQPPQTGTRPTGSGLGVVWHEASGGFLVWQSGSSLFKLKPPAGAISGTWTWSAVPAAGGAPSAPQRNGTTGRFNILENFAGSGRDLLVLVNSIDEPVYAYKLPSGGV